MFIIIDDDENVARGNTLQEAYDYYINYINDSTNFNDFKFYDAKEIKAKQEIKLVPLTTIKKVK